MKERPFLDFFIVASWGKLAAAVMRKELNPEILDSTYQALLALLDIKHNHETAFLERSISKDEAMERGYRSFPLRRAKVVEKLLTKVEKSPLGVPGFWRDDKGNVRLAGAQGICVPVRNQDGKIVSLKMRADSPKDPRHKYTLLSSNPKLAKFPEGTAALVSVHYPLGCPGQVDTLRITEGEIKADIATTEDGTYTVSIPGVALWKHGVTAAKELGAKKVLIAFDSDKDGKLSDYMGGDGEPVDIAKCLSALYLALKEEGFEVFIETWPPECGKGIDDVLVDGYAERIERMSDENAELFIEDAMRSDLPLGWVWITGIKRFYHQGLRMEFDKEQFSDHYAHKIEGGLAAQKALANPAFPKTDFPVYMPDRAPIYSEGGKTYCNLWKPCELDPCEGDVSYFLSHVAYILPDEREREIFLDYLAHCVQRPTVKIRWCIVLQGKQGTGKSYFGEVMRLVLGRQNVRAPSNEQLHEKYSEWQANCQFVLVEELMAHGRIALMNKLKAMITEEVAVIRDMYKPPYEQPNVYNFLMLTNHRDSIILEEGDRRWCVLFSDSEKKEASYYRNLFSETKRGAAALLYYLQKRDLSNFDAFSDAPMTEGKRELQRESLPPLEMWLADMISAEQHPFDKDLTCALHLADNLPPSLRGAKVNSISRSLRKVGASEIGQVPVEGHGRLRLWSVRRHEIWACANNKVRAEHYLDSESIPDESSDADPISARDSI